MNVNIKEIVPEEYVQSSSRFRIVWTEYVFQEEKAKSEIVKMVKSLETEGYNRTRAIQKIVQDHSDLKGFSRRTIYRELPQEMKQDRTSDSEKLSETISVPFGTDNSKDVEGQELQDDDGNKKEEEYQPSESLEEFRKKHGQKITESRTTETTTTRGNEFVFEYSIEITEEMFRLINANHGICPFLIFGHHDTENGYIRFDQKKIEREIKEANKKK